MTVGGGVPSQPAPPAAALAERLRNSSQREGGCLVAVATPQAPQAPELRALQSVGLAAVPIRRADNLPTVVAQLRPDLVLLDVAVCPTTSIDTVSELATVGAPAVIVCGSVDDPVTRAALLYAGADDCVLAPYRLEELIARVLAVLRRTQLSRQTRRDPVPLEAGPLRVDLDHHQVSIDGRPIELTVLEFRLLSYLLRHRGIALPRERLLADVWGHTIGTLETVTVHIRRLRSKIEVDPSRPLWIETVWGVGYRFRSEAG